jgi:signal transduction histidine kinase
MSATTDRPSATTDRPSATTDRPPWPQTSRDDGWTLSDRGRTTRKANAVAGFTGWFRRPLFGVRDLAVLPVAFAVALSLGEVLIIGQDGGGVWSRLAVLTMIAPVVFARRAPLTAAVTQAAATLVNGLALGHLVRCGACLPAAFYVAYVVANRSAGKVRTAGIAAVLAGVTFQCVYDPKLGLSALPFMVPATLLFFGAGLLVRKRALLVAQLRERNAQLRQQRERTAELAVAADQARIHSELIDGLQVQIREIAQTAAAARSGSSGAVESLAAIERTGRAALERMRDVVGTIRSAPTEPEPDLDALEDLLRSATACKVQLTIDGAQRALPASIELSGYRIIERLLSALEDSPAARAQVRVMFETEAIEFSVTGPLAHDFDPATSFTGIVDRANLHGGTVRLGEPTGKLDAYVRLPLVTSHA